VAPIRTHNKFKAVSDDDDNDDNDDDNDDNNDDNDDDDDDDEDYHFRSANKGRKPVPKQIYYEADDADNDDDDENDAHLRSANKGRKAVPIHINDADNNDDDNNDDDNDDDDDENDAHLRSANKGRKAVPIHINDDDNNDDDNNDDDNDDDDDENDAHLRSANKGRKAAPIHIDDDDDDDDDDDAHLRSANKGRKAVQIHINNHGVNQLTVTNINTNPVFSSSNIPSKTSDITGETKKTKEGMLKSKIKNKRMALKYFEVEAVDNDNLLVDDDEDGDENSDDERFIEKSDDSSEDDGDMLTRNEIVALQPHLWNHMQKIVIRGKSSELDPLQDYRRTILFQSTTGFDWLFRAFENKLGNTFFHAFLLPSDSLPDLTLPVDTSDAERLDFNIVLLEPIKMLDKSTSLSLRSFIVYKKICAFDFIEMLFKHFPKVEKILFPSSHKGLETAIKKCVFNIVKDEYVIYRQDHKV
jgi:hypothetical protein